MADPQQTSLPSDPILRTLPMALVTGLAFHERNRQRVARGRSIIVEGQSLTTLYLISKGWAVSKLSIGTGSTQILDLMGPGSLIGLSCVEEAWLSSYSVFSLQEVEVYSIPVKALFDLADQNVDVSRWLSKAFSRQIQRSQTHIAALGQLTARQRLAFAVLKILDVAQQTGESMVDKTIHLPMTQEEIGNMLGLTNVSISKLMSAFRREGLIDYGRNRITVQNVEALSKICGVRSEGIKAPDYVNRVEPIRSPFSM